MSAFGAAVVTQAGSLARALIPTNTTTTTSGTGSSSTSVDQTTSVSAKDHAVTSTAMGIDPEILQMLKDLATQAFSNSNDSNKTKDLVGGIVQSAIDAVSGIFGKQQASGAYDNSSTTAQNDNIISRASADAAAAVLGYQSNQEQVANDVLGKAAAATSVQTVTKDEAASTDTTVNGTTDQNTTSQSVSSSKGGASIICTYLNAIGIIPDRYYVITAREFKKYPISAQRGYLMLAKYLLKHLKRRPTSVFSKIIVYLFVTRTMQMCAEQQVRNVKSSWQGKMSKWVIATAVFFPGLYCWIDAQVEKFCTKYGLKLSCL